MFKHECYKIFTRKSIYVVLGLIILMMIYANRGDITLKEGQYYELYEEWGGPVTEEKLEKARDHMEASDGRTEGTITKDEYKAGEVHFLVASAGMNSARLQERKENLQLKLNQVEEDTFDHKAATMELTMLQKLKEPFGYYLISTWQGMFELIEPIVSVIFLSALIILGITPLFVDEYVNRTADLILTTKNGKRKIVTTKILVAITYISSMFLTLHLVNFVFQWIKFGGTHGWTAPMQNLYLYWSLVDFSGAPYHWSIWQFYFINLSVQLLGSIALGLLVILISLIFKNTLLTILTSVSILAFPSMLAQFALDKGLFSYIISFNYVEFIKAAPLFQNFKAYNILGQPILYPVVLLVLFALLTGIVLILIYHNYLRMQN